MKDELTRAVAFFGAMQDRMVERTQPFRFGTALFHDALPRVFYLNFLRVERGEPGIEELTSAADELQAHLAHRKVEVNTPHGQALERSFRELGWKAERDVVMIYRGTPARESGVSQVVEVGGDALEAKWEEGIRSAPFGTDEDVVRQLVRAQRLRERAIGVRYFAVREDGHFVTECSLFSDGEIAQVESVLTLEPYRGRGYASAVVARAVAEALAGGHGLVFLLADDEDWPKELYRRLGFEPAGFVWEFVREPTSGRRG